MVDRAGLAASLGGGSPQGAPDQGPPDQGPSQGGDEDKALGQILAIVTDIKAKIDALMQAEQAEQQQGQPPQGAPGAGGQ